MKMENTILNEFKKYLEKVFGTNIKTKKITDLKKIPYYLQEIFALFDMKLFDKTFIIAINISDELLTPAEIRKFLETIEKILDKKTVFVSDRITPWDRDRLINQKVQFIIPGNQMFIPFIGVDLREYFKAGKAKTKFFSPSAQSVIIKMILEKRTEKIAPELIMNFSGYSRMTVSRIIDELKSAGIIYVSFQRRNSVIEIVNNGKNLLNNVLPFLKNPKKESIWISEFDQKFREYFFCAGYSALSEYTMIGQPKVKTYAIDKRKFTSLIKKGFTFREEKYPEDAEIELELWTYPPEIAGNKKTKIVDKISLYKCFEETNDERVLQALEELRSEIEW